MSSRPHRKVSRKRKSQAPAGQSRVSVPASPTPPAHRWTFLSNHAHVLICLAQRPDVRLRDMAAAIGITERAVQKIVSDLEQEGLVERHRVGRRNSYELHLDHPLRHPLESHRDVRALVDLLLGD